MGVYIDEAWDIIEKDIIFPNRQIEALWSTVDKRDVLFLCRDLPPFSLHTSQDQIQLF